MNKKILSMAVAAAIAAPVAAQADVTVSGAWNMALYNTNENLSATTGSTSGGITGGDHGTSKLDFSVKAGDAFAKFGYDMKSANASLNSPRENYMGIKAGGVNVMLGRQSNMYNSGVKVDAMHATFLESRGHSGGVGKVDSFVSALLGVSGKSGDVSWGAQYGPAHQDTYSLEAPMMVFAKMKAGGADIGLGFYSDDLGNTSTGISAGMKFGDVSVKISGESVDGQFQGDATTSSSTTVVFADVAMPMGNGTVGLGIGSNTDASTTFTRVSYKVKANGYDWYVGAANDGADNQRVGGGMMIKF